MVLIAFLYFTYLHPDTDSRVIVSCLAAAILCLKSARVIYSRSLPILARRNIMLPLLFALMVLFYLVHATLTFFSQGKLDNMMTAGSIHSLGLMVSALLTIILYFGLMLINSQRLDRDRLNPSGLLTGKHLCFNYKPSVGF